jgi:HEPN domain-containing protein
VKTSEANPDDWIFLARERLRAADALWSQEGTTLSGVELLQEGVERLLKAFLISQGWSLRKVHDLAYLMEECIARDPSFAEFRDLAEQLTEQFWAQHYPGGDLTDVGSGYASMRAETECLVVRVCSAVQRAKRPDKPDDGPCPGTQSQ